MSKTKIFELLLKTANDEKPDFPCDYPDLIPESCSCIAKQLANMIHDPSKVKSLAAKEKRAKIIKFLLNLRPNVIESHLNVEDGNYNNFVEELNNVFKTSDVEEVIKGAQEEFDSCLPKSFADEVCDFYKRKNTVQRNKARKLEHIRKLDKEKLQDSLFKLDIKESYSVYETSENLIRSLLDKIKDEQKKGEDDIHLISHNYDYREKQIQCAYALLNLQSEHKLDVIKGILSTLMKYEKLENIEINFLQYLWLKAEDSDLVSSDVTAILVENFFFLVEILVIKICTEIILLKTEEDVIIYFCDLEDRKDFIRLKKYCCNKSLIKYKIKSIIYQLYAYSRCNKNLLKFCDIFK